MTSSLSNASGGNGGLQQLMDTMNGTSSSSASSASGSSSANSLQNTFLTLLVTQLQNQDPTNPMDSSQMTTQLAQINTVSGISQLNTTLTSLASQLSAGQDASYLGRHVLVPGSSAFVSNGASSGFGVSLSSPVADLQVTIKNSSGNIVNTLDLGPQAAGTLPIGWTPTDASGNTLPDGAYTISATGTSSSGASGPVTTLSGQQVVSVVQQGSGTTGLMLQDGTTVDPTTVAAIF